MDIQNPFQFVWGKTTFTNFSDFIFSKISKYGSQPALIDYETGKQWRFSEIKQFSETCVCRLNECGVTMNSRIALVTSTTSQAIFVHLANAIIGSTIVCINGFLSVDELWQQVDLSESTHCITENQFLPKVDEVRRKAVMRGGGRIRIIKTLDEVIFCSFRLLIKEESQLSLPLTSDSTVSTPTKDEQGGKDYPTELQANIEDLTISGGNQSRMFIFYSSGTTGLPKPVEISHQSLIINLTQICFPIYNVLTQKDRLLLPICLNHIYGMLSAYYALINGATLVMFSKYSIKGMLQALEEHKITQLHVTPPIIHSLASDPLVLTHNLSHLRSIIVSGSPLDINIAKICKERLQLKDFRQAYGMTELSSFCTFSHYLCENIQSVGVPLPGMLIRIVHWESKQLCQPRQIGQLLVSGPQVMPSFYKNPKATYEILDSNKMVRTGDAGYYDEKGYIYVIGRIKDMIKYKGTLVCPSEVEAIMRTHPGIDDCAVIGRQDHVSGEVPAAFVVRNPQHSMLSSAEVRQFVSGKIAQFKELRGGVYFISEIPRNVCGKILRKQLKQHWDRERITTTTTSSAIKGDTTNVNMIHGSNGTNKNLRRNTVTSNLPKHKPLLNKSPRPRTPK
uniref:Luciferase n=1 Tax=Panagrolaimus sp. PS1159 TaxID=55785 RepID=A0AC35FF73_9BILA